ncbi:13950_t:CDS:1, partial [Gigaspora rosea]
PNRIVRSRRSTFPYGEFDDSQPSSVPLCSSQPIVGSSSIDGHCELVPYSKEWTVIMW